MHATNTSPSIISFYASFPPPPSPSFFLVFSAFAFQLCRDLRPPPPLLPLAPPRFLTGSDCLKIPDSAEKKPNKTIYFLAWMAEGREKEGAGGGTGGEERAGTTQLNTNPISWRQGEGGEAWPAL